MSYDRLCAALFAVFFVIVFWAGLFYLAQLFVHVIAEAIV